MTLMPRKSWAFCARIWVLTSILVVPLSARASGPTVIDIQPCPSCRIVDGSALEQITLTFSEPVEFAATDFELRSRRNLGGTAAFSLMQTSPSATVTLMLDAPVVDDVITVVIDYSIRSAASGQAMDGEWPGGFPKLPTGNAQSGGQCVVQYKVLQGDVNGDGFVNVADQILVGLHHGDNIAPCSCSANPPAQLYDVDGDGVVEADTPGGNDEDLLIVTDAISRSMPLTDGVAPAVDLITPDDGAILCDDTVGSVDVVLTHGVTAETVTTSTLFATDRLGVVHTSDSATLSGDGVSIDFAFNPPLSMNEVYDFTLSESLADADGDLLTRNTFEVIAAIDPVILQPPADDETCEGAAASFSVAADSAAPLAYQWRKNGVNISGETGATLDISAAELADADDYDVVVSNACGSGASQSASLTVNALPVFEVQPPAAAEVCEEESTSLAVTVSGNGPFAYQWRKDGGALSGEVDSQLDIDSALESDEGVYDVQVTDVHSCSLLSSSTSFSVNLPPVISSQPKDVTDCEGENGSLSVSASGTGTLSYQWRRDGVDLSGENFATLNFGTLQLADAGGYDVEITDAKGCISVSGSADVTVNDLPVITQQPESVSALELDLVTFAVSATDSTALTYQWRKNGVNIAGATSSTYSIPAAALEDAGSYDVAITDGTGCEVISQEADLSVDTSAEEIAPGIVTPPSSQTACEGLSVTFSVVAEGTPPLAYQWRLNGANIAGATSDFITLDLISLEDSGSQYDVVVTNALGSITSGAAELLVQALPTITIQPQSQNVIEGVGVVLSVTAGGEGIGYQWRRNGIAIANATAASFTLPAAQLTDAGVYDVVITGTCGALTSEAATLSVSIALTNTNDNVVDPDNENVNDNESILPPGGGGGGIDRDDDGVGDDLDLCPDTPANIPVDANGCPLEDEDVDGVLDPVDECPDTAEGVLVDEDGCPVSVVITNDNGPTEPPAGEDLPGNDFDSSGDDSSRRNSSAACGACGGIGFVNFAVMMFGLLLIRLQIVAKAN